MGPLRMFTLAVTCQRMHREGLVWLDDVHLELKVDGAAASQRDSMTNTADRKEHRDVISIFFFFNDLTPTGERKRG